MGTMVRWILGFIISAFLTFWLFVGMKALISGEFKPQKKVAQETFDINPEVEDIKIAERRTTISKVKRVETPPPPPQIERIQAVKPTEQIASIAGEIPKFEIPKIERNNIKIQVSDRDAQPLVRLPPRFPNNAERSGHCRMRFDVNPEGQPYNIVALSCSRKTFERNSIKCVQGWKYRPKIVDGRPTSYKGVETKITFRLTDEKGNVIPE